MTRLCEQISEVYPNDKAAVISRLQNAGHRVAAGAMGLSSLFVVSNSLRLRRFDGYRSTTR